MFRFIGNAVNALAQANQLSQIAERCTDAEALRQAVLGIIRRDQAQGVPSKDSSGEEPGRYRLVA